MCVRLRANGRNIVDQQLPTLLDVTCCVRLHTLLHVVGCCCAKFETGRTFRPVQTDRTLLAFNSQHCWELLRPFARSLTLFFMALTMPLNNFRLKFSYIFFSSHVKYDCRSWDECQK